MRVYCWREEREEVLIEIYHLMREEYAWEFLLPFRKRWYRQEWVTYAQRSWLFPMFGGRRFGGYVMVSHIRDGWGEIHFATLPWVSPFLARRGAEKVFSIIRCGLRGVSAYIPNDRPEVARFARLLGFEHADGDEYRKAFSHGRKQQSQSRSSPGTTTSGAPGDRGG